MPKFRKSKNKPSRNRNPLYVDIESANCPYSKPKKNKPIDSFHDSLYDNFPNEDQLPFEIPQSLGKKILDEANQQLLHDLYDDEMPKTAISTEFNESEEKSGFSVDNNGFVCIDENELRAIDNAGMDDSYWSELLKNDGNEDQLIKNIHNQSVIVDSIVSRLRENNLGRELSDETKSKQNSNIPEKVAQVYTSIGEWLSKYKSGKLPKAFTIIPKLENWEEVVYLTDPNNWSPNAMNEAVRIFCSNLSPKDSLKFYSKILYPTIRTNISQNYGKLNYHYYQALKKAIFKPAAWFKGILLPLAEDETCTIKEAIIIGSILSKVSIPVLHTAAAIIKLSQIKIWNTCQTHFIMVLLSKKYSMPKKVIDELVDNFTKFDQKSINNDSSVFFSHNNINLNSSNIQTNSILPITWHKTLLVFVQRYKYEFSLTQIKRLNDLVRSQHHYLISPEIIRELSHSLIKVPNEATLQ
ncbi:bystin EN1P like adaptor domain-containing protein [Cryptosporidium ubiquitum]|uniref:Bystin EN1P like adaptor domain-containing protein n=1 Tax=Cryptosporidium ubiquitum TaxID=857276 RepID=A0A1J4MK59_9CRYT|nr:bystin EN1P like adaptor domain-containing protein [Cryptosporidium ubiquitum]OII74608.1 bystin EN1P like adaptor domain-containing protein [Cryptosporidium ubiquitum]